jgi:WD40 repeat protein
VYDNEERFLRLVDIKAGGKIVNLLGHQDEVSSVAFSPDGKLVVSGSLDKTVRIWDVASAKEVFNLTGHFRAVGAVAFSSNGRLMASADGVSRDTTGGDLLTVGAGKPLQIRLWDVATGKELLCLEGHAVHSTSLAFSPDGTRLLAGFHNGTALIWDVSRFTRLR